MAETLGSLLDKLIIKDIREFHIKQMIEQNDPKFSKEQLKEKLDILNEQKNCLFKEIEQFIILALKGEMILRDEKLKIYNKADIIGKLSGVDSVAKAIDGLAKKNLELWHLEDEARREDVELSYIGEIKRKIDVTNQQRNDFIDRIDELLDQQIKNSRL